MPICGRPRSIAICANAAEVYPELVDRGIIPDLVTEQTAAHDPLRGYVPIGLSLDNFDVTGAWRIKDRGVPVNLTSELYDGTPLNGVADLRAALLAKSDVVVTHLTERLLSYALGRRVEHSDMPAVRKIVREARTSDYRMSALILGVVKSAAFQTALAEVTEDRGK